MSIIKDVMSISCRFSGSGKDEAGGFRIDILSSFQSSDTVDLATETASRRATNHLLPPGHSQNKLPLFLDFL